MSRLQELTHDQIKAMPAGPVLDVLVAETILGWADVRFEKIRGDVDPECLWPFGLHPRMNVRGMIPFPSREYADAVALMEFLAAKEYEFVCQTWEGGDWTVCCTMPDGHDTGDLVGPFALAVTRAALAAVRLCPLKEGDTGGP